METHDEEQPSDANRQAVARPWRVVNRRTPPTPDEQPAARCGDPPPEGLLLGVEQFNRREYFECHETLEAVWNAEPGLIRVLYKGILQVGVGCYHLLRGNYRGALIKLQSGADYLEPYAPQCMGIEVGRLLADARRLRAEVERLGPEHLREIDLSLLPVIQMDGLHVEGEHAPGDAHAPDNG